jgi:hypothetical protein
MSTAEIMKRIAEASPRLKARMACVFDLLTMPGCATSRAFREVASRSPVSVGGFRC